MEGRGFRHPYLWGRDHPWLVDGCIAAAVAVLGVATELTAPVDGGLREPNGLSVTIVVASTVPLIWRRSHPVVAFALIWPLMVVHGSMLFPGPGPFLAALMALYAVATHARTRRTALVVGTVAAASSLLAMTQDEIDVELTDVLGMWAFIGVAWVLGDNMRVRRAYLSTVEERAERLERERDAEARRAVLEERTRIARELHDVVAHGMSVMVVQAGAARRTLAAGDPERATEALRTIESTGRDALEEMRRLVGVLRTRPEARSDDGTGDPAADGAGAGTGAAAEGDDEDAVRLAVLGASTGTDAPALLPQPSIADLDELVAHCRDVGLDVTLQVAGPRRELPSGLELVVYRIAQEALTNTIRHAGPAKARVCLEYTPDRL